MHFGLFGLDVMEKKWAQVMEVMEVNSILLGFEFLKVKEETKENILKKEVKSQAIKT